MDILRLAKVKFNLLSFFLFMITVCSTVWSHSAIAADAKLIHKILKCESGMRPNAIGDNGLSRGIAQFRKETFYEFATMAAKKWRKTNLGKPHWTNPAQQIFLLEWGLDNGYGKRWTCYRTITAKQIKRTTITLAAVSVSHRSLPGKVSAALKVAYSDQGLKQIQFQYMQSLHQYVAQTKPVYSPQIPASLSSTALLHLQDSRNSVLFLCPQDQCQSSVRCPVLISSQADYSAPHHLLI